MFSRWCQENFFNYMMQHFDIDVLLDYDVTEFYHQPAPVVIEKLLEPLLSHQTLNFIVIANIPFSGDSILSVLYIFFQNILKAYFHFGFIPDGH